MDRLNAAHTPPMDDLTLAFIVEDWNRGHRSAWGPDGYAWHLWAAHLATEVARLRAENDDLRRLARVVERTHASARGVTDG